MTPDARTIEFAATPLAPEAPGIASRALDVGGTRWALVEYEPNTLREEYCDEGHSGYVLEGAVTYEFSDGRPELAVQAGKGFTLPDDSSHRGRSGPAGVRMFLIDRAG